MNKLYIKININKSYELLQTNAIANSDYLVITQIQWDSIERFNTAHINELQYARIDAITLIPYIDIAAQLLDMQKAKEIEIRAAAAHQVDLIVKPYYDWEQKSWFKQTSEAEAWTMNNMAVTPYIDAAVAARKLIDPAFTKAMFVSNVLAKRDAFDTAVGSINGKQGALIAKIYDPATTVASIQAITW